MCNCQGNHSMAYIYYITVKASICITVKAVTAGICVAVDKQNSLIYQYKLSDVLN